MMTLPPLSVRHRPRRIALLPLLALGAFAQPAPAQDSTEPAAPAPAAAPGHKKSYGDDFTFAKLPQDLKIQDDIVYKTVNGEDLKLVLFNPPVKKFDHAPLLIFIHGGGWTSGNRYVVIKAGAIDVVRQLNAAGFVCASIEYRLVKPGGPYGMEAAADCRDAVHFFVKNADRFGIDPQRIVTMGGSAGGNLSLITALGDDKDYPCDAELAKYPGKIVAEVAYFPLVSMVDPALLKDGTFDRSAHIESLIGGPMAQNQAVAEKLSPTVLLKADSCPLFLAQGQDDHTLTVQNVITMAADCKEKGVPYELLVVKNADHGFRVANGGPMDPPLAEISRQAVAFVEKYALPAAAK